ncbi:MAG: beta-lactamase family protein [Proteobacteria bacterium]|nr:beta-lactamase family protein [Pseudomonadota bacterium]
MKQVSIRKQLWMLFVLFTVSWAVAGCESVQDIVEDVHDDTGVPALAAGYTVYNAFTNIGATGVLRIDQEDPVDVDKKFMIGSCTKSMTATVIGMLVEENKLTWETKLQDVFPEFCDIMNEDYLDVSVKEILSHTAGFQRDPSSGESLILRQYGNYMSPTKSRYNALKLLLKKPSSGTKGMYFYSNIGYIIAGAIAETRAGISYEELLHLKIFTPLHMTSAGFGYPPWTLQDYPQPYGHQLNSDGTRTVATLLNPVESLLEWSNAVWRPAGGVKCSIGDFLKYVNWHLQGELGNGGGWPKTMFETLHEPVVSAIDEELGPGQYALGWRVMENPIDPEAGTIIAHGGNVAGFNALMVFSPSDNTAIATFTNTNKAMDILMLTAGNIYNSIQ